MRTIVWLSGLLLLHTPASLPPSLPFHPSVSDLAWLEGVWRGRIGNRDFEARYTGPEGGLVLSASKYSSNGKAAGFEFERFEDKDGAVVLTPYPDGKSSVSFRLTDYDERLGARCSRTPSTTFRQGSATSGWRRTA